MKKLLSIILCFAVLMSVFIMIPFRASAQEINTSKILVDKDTVGAGKPTILWPSETCTTWTSYNGHNAIDIPAASGTSIRAAYSGTVKNKYTCSHNTYYWDNQFPSCCYGHGTGLVILGDDGRYYDYAHMISGSIPSNINVGTRITMGQEIGKVGDTGCAQGAHLHFSIYADINFKTYLGAEPENQPYIYSLTPPTPSFSINDVSDITETNAYISCSQITNPSRGTMTRVGFQMGTSSKNYTISKYDDLPSWTSNYITCDYRMSDVSVTLSPCTKYYYRFYIVISGTTYYSDEKSFTTTGKNFEAINLGDDFVAHITNSKSGMNVGANSVANVELQTKSDSDFQKWHFVRQSDNSYKIINTGHNQCMDVANFGTANGTNIGLCPSNDTNAQRYYIRYNNFGFGIIPKVNTNAALDISGGSLTNGANIQEYTWNGTNAQTFSIDYIGLESAAVKEKDGHTYEYYNMVMPWNQAYRFCESKGGHLVTISDDDENNFVHGMISSNSWIGSTSINNSNKWYWITNEPFDYTNWNAGEPNCYNSIEYYGVMLYSGSDAKKWNDLPNTTSMAFVCEYDNNDVDADSYTPTESVTVNGTTFSVYDYSVDWQTAEAICKAKGGRLVKIDSAAKNNAVTQLMAKGSKPEYWINVTDRNSEGIWTDSEGDLLSYFNWKDGDPSNDFNAEQYGIILKDSGKWIDLKGFSPAYRNTGFICEIEDSTEPQPSEDGWIYCDFLPSYVTSNKYIIEYDNYYEKQQKDSPGSDWVKAETIKNEWVNSGSQYSKTEELSTSDSRILVGTSYYHYCGGGAPSGYSNYEVDNTNGYVHYDGVANSMIGSRKYLGNDNGHWYYALYDKSGNPIWCQSGVTCDGSFGSHGKRSDVWYATFTYQDRVKVELYKYTKDSGWVETADSSALSTKIRYKKIASEKIIGDVNGDENVDVLDAAMVQKYTVNRANLSEEQLSFADVNNDNHVDVLDAAEIQKFAAGKITEFKKKV